MKNLFFYKLEEAVRTNNSRLCIGLDPRVDNIPEPFNHERDPIFAFNKAIIDATVSYACAFKPNFAFYEAAGVEGISALKKTIDYIPPEIPIIADAKRGDIGSTAEAYAQAVFDYLHCDAVTLSPYLGEDSLIPYFNYKDKGLFILCLTSNPGASDFQLPNDLHIQVAQKVMRWNTSGNCGLVVGATKPDYIRLIREMAPDIHFLIPGIGTQGGDIEKVLEFAPQGDGTGYIINVSRGITQPSGEGDFITRVVNAAAHFRKLINAVKEK